MSHTPNSPSGSASIANEPTRTPTNEPSPIKGDTLADVCSELRSADKVVIATHENPDGDAIGSLRSMELIARALGKDVVAYVPGGVVPREYEFIAPDEGPTGDVPADIAERVVFAVDCGNDSRLGDSTLLSQSKRVINVDHHADNTHYGDVNVVRGSAACATQLVYELAGELGVALTPELSTALYVGLVTDTGRFQYSNTNAYAFDMAADLVRNGVDVHEVFREVYEKVEYRRLKLLARGLENARRFDENRVIVTYLTADDFSAADADADSAEGIVDYLRGVEGTMLAMLVRDLDADGKFARKGSLRTTDDVVDVSVIARTYNGGGHRQAAGFSTDDSIEQIIDRVREQLVDQLAD